ncbi:uracil DNA N-glycosylase Thp1 [Rhodotorula toruloides]
MSAEDVESSPDLPAAPSPAFAAHLDRFRLISPTSRHPTPPTPIDLTQEPKQEAAKHIPRKAPARSRRQSTGTPPRPDGTSTHFKREGVDADAPVDGPSPRKKKKKPARPYADPSQYADLGDNPLPDYLKDRLDVLLCGINPGVKSAQSGFHYANPTNHFWSCLSESGLTDRRLHPSEGPLLPNYGIGSTNLVQRPSAEMSEISNDEMKERVPFLLEKVVRCKPRILAFVGMKICEVVMRYLHNLPKPEASTSTSSPSSSPSKGRRKAMPKVKIGLQAATISYTPDIKPEERGTDAARQKTFIWCLPSTSARVVEYQLVDKIKIWKMLKADLDQLGGFSSPSLDLPEGTVDYPAESLFPASSVTSDAVATGGSALRVTLVKLEDIKPSLAEEAWAEETAVADGTG